MERYASSFWMVSWWSWCPSPATGGRPLAFVTIVIVWLAPGASDPRLQSTVPLACVQPAGVTETKSTSSGSLSCTVTLRAVDGPSLWATSVYVTVSPPL